MESEQNSAAQEKPADEKPVSAPARPGQNPDRQGPRRPPFRRGGRGGRGGRGDREPRADQARPAEAPHRKPPGSIRSAIEHVEVIRGELKKVLDEIHEVLRILDQVEREKTASEDEIEQLRDSIRPLHRDMGYPRPQRSLPPRPAPAPEPAATETEAETEQQPDDTF